MSMIRWHEKIKPDMVKLSQQWLEVLVLFSHQYVSESNKDYFKQIKKLEGLNE